VYAALNDVKVAKPLTDFEVAADVEVANKLGAMIAVVDLVVELVPGLVDMVLREGGHGDSSPYSRQ
jgi:hypothetical protein